MFALVCVRAPLNKNDATIFGFNFMTAKGGVGVGVSVGVCMRE